MLKVVAVSDKTGTAIDRLCRGVAPYHQNITYTVCDVHPKRPDADQLARFEAAARDADIIDYQYFRTADMLRERYDWLKDKPSILTHNNPYSINERDWNDYQIVVANNKTMEADLSHITSARLEYIPLTVDTRFWQFNNDWKPKDQVILVANRIESKKGLLEAAIASVEAGLDVVLVGAISDQNYFNDIMATGKVTFYEQVSDDELKDLYYESLIHICNSQDNFESGTLPILEAMLCGVPVITRKVGHVPDIYNGENMIINENSNEDVVKLAELIKSIDRDKLNDIREKAWKSVKGRGFSRRAYGYQKLYRTLVDDKPTVSIVMPIFGKPEITKQTLEAVKNQTYKNIELIICNDNMDDESNSKLVAEYSQSVPFMVRYINQPEKGYGLAKQRNLGIIEATGEIIVFCDQRIKMDEKAVEVFVESIKPHHWLYGTKGVKKEFVENFSAVYRGDVIKIGMFCERIDKYGGQSQEVRSRAKYNGMTIDYIEKAKAEQIGKSSAKYQKRDEIIEIKDKLWKMGMEL